MAEASREQLLADIKSINKDTAFSDLIIKCGADTYNVHKNVVAARSSVFAKALTFPGKEAEQGVIDLSDNEPAVVRLLVQYSYEAEYDPVLSGFAPSWDYENTPAHTCSDGPSKTMYRQGRYFEFPLCLAQICPHHRCGENCSMECESFICGECRTPSGNFQGTANDMVTHAKMYEMADKYDISGLKQLCIEKYKQTCIVFWDDLKFAESAYHVYSTTPTRDKGLRNIVCKIISLHMQLLKKPEIEDLMNEFNGLAFGLLFDKAE